MYKHSYQSLRQARLARATKPFNARGARLIRCDHCQLAHDHCICAHTTPEACNVDWVLMMHADEILKPTNTGRLLGDVFPTGTFVFEWARVDPPEELLSVLKDPGRLNALVFPAENALDPSSALRLAQQDNRRLTLFLLDGTWKQARKMFNRTPWLTGLPSICVPSTTSQYALRKAAHEGCLSTAEAAIGVLEDLDTAAADALRGHFTRFNQAYVRSRGVRPGDAVG